MKVTCSKISVWRTLRATGTAESEGVQVCKAALAGCVALHVHMPA